MSTKVDGSAGIEFPDSTVQASAAYSKAESDALLSGPAFRAFQTGSGQGPAPAGAVVIFTDTQYDTANCFTPGVAAKFQPTVAGYYFVSGAVALASPAAATDNILGLHKNGVSIARLAQVGGDGRALQFSGSCLVYMNGTTDYLQLWFYSTAGILVLSGEGAYFQGFLARKA